MTRLPTLGAIAFVGLGLVYASTSSLGGLALQSAQAQAAPTGSCSLSQVAFCETFDSPAGTGNRSGQMNGTVWGVSRVNTSGFNFGQGQYDSWFPAQLAQCGGSTVTVQPPNDVVVCNGQMREVVNDGSDVTVLTAYAKQPFDFANRTGTITFDVSNDTQGSHTVWPELWLTDKPVPAPFLHFIPGQQPQHGFGVRFAANSGGSFNSSTGAVLGPHCTNDSQPRWTVDSAVVVRNYVVDDTESGGTLKVTPDDCVVASPGPDGPLNHVEVKVSQNQLDVYATDAGTSAPLHHLATIANANLTLTRGLVWIEDAHYNANKFGCHCQSNHTFTWDNIGFDGPQRCAFFAFDPNATPECGYALSPSVQAGRAICADPLSRPVEGQQS